MKKDDNKAEKRPPENYKKDTKSRKKYLMKIRQKGAKNVQKSSKIASRKRKKVDKNEIHE